MKKASQYFYNQEQEVNQKFMNADGDEFYADSFVDDYADGEMYAEGAGQFQSSDPFIIQLVNNSTSNISNIELFNSSKNYPVTGNNIDANVTLTFVSDTMSYTQLLGEILTVPRSIGEIYMYTSGTNASIQLTSTLYLRNYSSSGTYMTKQLNPTKDPYQQQTDAMVFRYAFNVTSMIGLVVSTLYASTTVKFQFYPSKVVNLNKSVTGQSVVTRKVNPGIVRPAVR